MPSSAAELTTVTVCSPALVVGCCRGCKPSRTPLFVSSLGPEDLNMWHRYCVNCQYGSVFCSRQPCHSLVSPPRNDSFRSLLMFYCSFIYLFVYFAMVFTSSIGWSLRNFAPWSAICCALKIGSKHFHSPSQTNVRGQKHAKFGPISDNFKLRWRISPKRINIFRIVLINRNFSCIRQKKFGELWSTNYGDLRVESYPPKLFFWETIFWPLGGAVPPYFYTCYRMTKSY